MTYIINVNNALFLVYRMGETWTDIDFEPYGPAKSSSARNGSNPWWLTVNVIGVCKILQRPIDNLWIFRHLSPKVIALV